MCGFAGFVGDGGTNSRNPSAIARRMGMAIAHRGPDSSGIWRDAPAELTLVHRRLSVVDLSHAGHQPMASRSGRYMVTFNGEIYNHLDIRKELERTGHFADWRGSSDTETLLAAIEAWGLEATLLRSTGMFALALWDREDRSLALVRDRMGEKPLYYGWQGGVFLFGSELKALREHPCFSGDVDRGALALLMRQSYIPAPFSIYDNIEKVPAGHILRLDSKAFAAKARVIPTPFWSLTQAIARGQSTPFAGNDAEAVSALDTLLRKSIARQMIADVPLGAFLSGGIDSSTVVALMQAQSSRPVKTFTIGFEETGYNEASHAKAMAQHLRTEHTELYVSPRDAEAIIPRLSRLYDEPFADSSQIPTFLLSEMTRRHVTVSLSGDGGDELFSGYNRYRGAELWARLHLLPRCVRDLATRAALGLDPVRWNAIVSPFQRLFPGINIGDKLHKGATLVRCRTAAHFHDTISSKWADDQQIVIGAPPIEALSAGSSAFPADLGQVEMMMALDTVSYLADGILAKVDRAAMGVSLETRVPLLDHAIVEFAWRLPSSMKVRDGRGKWILRKLLDRYIPRALLDRPKMGFRVPIDQWLRGSLRDWAEDLLDADRLKREGFLNPVPVRRKWREHLSGARNWQSDLWNVLMFQAWQQDDKKHLCADG